MRPRSARDRRRIVLILATLAAVIAVLVIAGGDDRPSAPAPPAPPATTPTVAHVDGPDADTKRDDELPLDAAAQEVLEDATAAPDKYDLGGDLRGDDPHPAGVLEGPRAAQEWPGCRTAFVRSFSSRGASRPELVWLHYTAGANRRGWSDLDGLTAYSNTVRNQVSWHFGIDREGHCAYNVPLRYKAWAAANANPTAINIEVVGTGREPDYAGSAGFRRVAAVVTRIVRLYPNIKLRLGGVRSCRPTRSGIVTHWMGGACSGGHVDIRPYSLPPLIARIAAAARASRPRDPRAASSYRLKVLTAGERRNASCLLAERRVAHRAGGWTKVASSHQRRANVCKAELGRSARWLSDHRRGGQRAERLEVVRKVRAGRP